MIAKMINDDYIDLVQEYPYKLKKIYGDKQHLTLDGSPRLYQAASFQIFRDDGKKISHAEAYRLQQFEKVKKKFKL